jgi:two-component system sensor histidine kinase YesM
MLKLWYSKYFRSRFFSRILIVNTAIVLLMMTVLVSLISHQVAAQISEKELNFNTQILESVSKYYDQKLKVVRQMIEQIYYDPDSYDYVFELLEPHNTDSYDYKTNRTKLESYLDSSFTRDADITNIAIYSNLNDESYLYSTNLWRIKDEKYFKTLDWFTGFNNELYGLRLTPAYQDTFTMSNSRWIFTIGSNLKSKNITSNSGILLVNFDAASIGNAYQPYKNRVKGKILIIDREGKLIYDSKGEYEALDSGLQQRILGAGGKTVSLTDGSLIVNILPGNDGTSIVGVIEKTEMYHEVNQLKRNIYLLGVLCTVLMIVLNGMGMNVFSKKVKRIIRAISHPPVGLLQQKLRLDVSHDEIGQIAFRFNLMQDKLMHYINEVYISDIKYKNAALAALQAQINPHFLSNTLEAIRMKAVKEGNEDVADMIYILSFLLRTSLKHDVWVSIREEISYCELYLQLFTLRYPNKLNIEIAIDKDIEPLAIGKLTLQPIVENSIQHGVDLQREGNTIKIRGWQDGGDIHISVEDNGKGLSSNELTAMRAKLAGEIVEGVGEGIGLLNVHERLRLQFGEPYGLHIDSGEYGTKVTISLPSHRIEVITNVQSHVSG